MTDSIETRVARGVALLDKTLADWDERIDLDRLDLRSTCNCVLGQEFANHPDVRGGDCQSYDVGLEALLGDERDINRAAREHGFDSGYGASHAPLTAEWKRVIAARRIDRMSIGGAS